MIGKHSRCGQAWELNLVGLMSWVRNALRFIAAVPLSVLLNPHPCVLQKWECQLKMGGSSRELGICVLIENSFSRDLQNPLEYTVFNSLQVVVAKYKHGVKQTSFRGNDCCCIIGIKEWNYMVNKLKNANNIGIEYKGTSVLPRIASTLRARGCQKQPSIVSASRWSDGWEHNYVKSGFLIQ